MISEIKFGKKYCRITFKLLFLEIIDSLAQDLPLETPIRHEQFQTSHYRSLELMDTCYI